MWQLRNVVVVLVLSFLLVGCGTQRAAWPAHVVSLDGFTEAEAQEVRASIDKLNAQADKPLIEISGEASQNAYLIHIDRHEPWPDDPMTAGLTTREDDLCSVSLSTELFKSDREGYVDSVVWHELGHCAGLTHNPKQGTMMFATAKLFTTFTNEALKSFIQDMRNSLSSEALGQ